MTRTVVTAWPMDSLAEAAATMRRGRFRHLPIVEEDGRLVGIVTHRDVVAAQRSSLELGSDGQPDSVLASFTCGEAMETHLSTTFLDEPAADAARRMIDQKIGCLPVVEPNGHLAGILTEEDFLRWAAEQMSVPTRPRTGSD
jgi:CBS domain-containing protein